MCKEDRVSEKNQVKDVVDLNSSFKVLPLGWGGGDQGNIKKQDLTPRLSCFRTYVPFVLTDILEWFRDEAEREGRGYQTAINQALRNYIKQDRRPLQDIVREVVRKELRELKKAS